ncbi:MAG: beta-lactamase family protein [Thermoanaerobaculales bacterium]|jgi:D-alanyl-D-alanine carboxypeptidase|nr:beta-lactamase family protein [Thermoanaerobaculales bacterium]
MHRSCRLAAVTLAALAYTALAGCAPKGRGSDSGGPGDELQRLVESVVAADDAIHGAALAVVSPSLGIDWRGAAGLADPSAGTPMTPDRPVRLASNTKTYVAAAVLRLVEERRLELDAPIAALLPADVADLLAGDGYDPDAITVRHLLTHTSGLFDHSGTGDYTEAILADPQRRWTARDQVALAVELGAPHAAPGEVYTYCDTGYVLLGLIIEGVTGRGLAASVRELVGLDRLGLGSTWWESLEPPPAGVADRAHQLYGEIDTYGFDPSFDLYGGGGLVATVGDLAGFFGALFRGGVWAQPATAEIMLTTVDGVRARADAPDGALPPGAYRMGVWVLETAGRTSYHHTGFFGTMVAHVPSLDLTVAATVNQNRGKPALTRLLDETVAIVDRSR